MTTHDAKGSVDHELAARYRSVVETATDGIIVIDSSGIIDSVNAAAERLFGYPGADLVGCNVSVLMPEPYRSEHDAYIRRFIETGHSRVIGTGREVLGRRRDGSVFPMRLSVGEMRIGERRMFTGIVHDLAEKHDLEAELTRAEAKLGALAQEAALRRVATSVAAQESTEAVMDLIAEEVRRLLDADAGLVLSVGPRAAPVVGATLGESERIEHTNAGPALVGHVADQEVPEIVCLDLHPEDGVRAWAADSGLRAAVLAPITLYGRPWGAIAAATRRRRFASSGAIRLLGEFADLATLAIGNAASQSRLRRLASTDSLTGLSNRRSFDQALELAYWDACDSGEELTLVLFDVDHFKDVNDRFGHQAGDVVLQDIANTLRAVARRDDTLARVGGEEFAWLLPRATVQMALGATSRLSERLSTARVPPLEGGIHVSGGICSVRFARSPEELVGHADDALYWAKGHGRDRFVVYGEEPMAESQPSPRRAADPRQ